MAEIREQIEALAARRALAKRLLGRPDIIGLAAHMIACQDAACAGKPIPTAPTHAIAGLPTADEIAQLLSKALELSSADCSLGLKVPGGVRHSLFHWSPILQLRRLESVDGCVAGRAIEELPHDLPSLIRWLEVSMGLRDPDWIEPGKSDLDHDDEQIEIEAAEMFTAREEFEIRFGFSIAGYAKWLLGCRQTDPVLYLLILSREYLLALRWCPALGTEPTAGPSASVPGLALPIIVAAMTIGELQRLVALYRDLVSQGPITTSEVRDLLDANPAGVPTRSAAIAQHIRDHSAAGRVFEHASMRSEALRNRLFRMPQRKRDEWDRNSLVASLFRGQAEWDIAASVGSPDGAHELRAATLAPAIFDKGVRGRGWGYRSEPLDLYYGVPHSYLLHLGVTELGRPLTGKVDRSSSIAVAARIMKIVSGSDLVPLGTEPKDSGVHERLHKQAVKALTVFLPPFPDTGSAGRFVGVAWLNPTRDASVFRHLARRIQFDDPRLACDDKAGKFYFALWCLQAWFPKLYDDIRSRRFSVRITCDLATSASVLTSDPIMRSMVLQGADANFPKAPRRQPHIPKQKRDSFPKATKGSVTRVAILKEIERALRGGS